MALISKHPSSARQKNLETHILSHFDSTMSTKRLGQNFDKAILWMCEAAKKYIICGFEGSILIYWIYYDLDTGYIL